MAGCGGRGGHLGGGAEVRARAVNMPRSELMTVLYLVVLLLYGYVVRRREGPREDEGEIGIFWRVRDDSAGSVVEVSCRPMDRYCMVGATRIATIVSYCTTSERVALLLEVRRHAETARRGDSH